MPYVCNRCGGSVSDDVAACPACMAPKAHWTIIAERTRTFVVGKGFTLHRGRSLRPGGREAELVPATSARAVGKRAAAGWAERGLTPPPRYVLVVRYKPTAASRDVELAIGYGTKEAGEVTFEPPADAAPDGAGTIDVPLLFVYGGDDEAPPTFAGVAVVDLGEPGPGGEPSFAPSLEVRALRKPWRALPVEAAGARWSVREAREGDAVEAIVDTEQPDGAKVDLAVLEHDADGEHDPVTTLAAEAKDGEARAPWTFELTADDDDVDEGPLAGVPEYLFRAAPDGEPLESGLLRYRSWIEVELRGQDGAPIAGRSLWLVRADGGREERPTDERGVARWDPVAPGSHTITDELPDEDDEPRAGVCYLEVGDRPDGEDAADEDHDFELVVGEGEAAQGGGGGAGADDAPAEGVDFELVIGRR